MLNIINLHINYIQQITKNNVLINIFNSTRDIYYRRRDVKNNFGLHAMRNNSKLDGSENYFTTDLNDNPQNVYRILWRMKLYKSGEIKYIKLLGVVDTHNTIDEDAFNEMNIQNIGQYLKIPVTNRITNVRINVYIKKLY